MTAPRFPVSRDAYLDLLRDAQKDPKFREDFVKQFSDFLRAFFDDDDVVDMAMARFDRVAASEKYPPLHLVCSRSWTANLLEEWVDGMAYAAIERKKLRVLAGEPVGR